MNDTTTVTYDVTYLEDFTEVTRTKREAALYNKYAPEFIRRFPDEVVYPGAYRFVVEENSHGKVISMTYRRVVYTRKEIVFGIIKSIFVK